MLKPSSHAGVQHFCTKLAEYSIEMKGARGLVIGFGEGHEAEFLCHALNAFVAGIDIRSRIPAGQRVSFQPAFASAIELPFPPASFDFVFYHHVIEHVPDPARSLAEIARVLTPEGILYVGTPNIHRVIGYMGAYQKSWRRKIRNNLVDYKDRFIGRFKNEYGAHAGFSQKELDAMLTPLFQVQWLTKDYLIYKYSQRLPEKLLAILTNPSVMEYAAPSIYALCQKTSNRT